MASVMLLYSSAFAIRSPTTTLKASKPRVAKLKAASAVADVPSGGGGGTATISNEIFNLVKNIVGAGVLSLPAGIAAFGNAPSALIPASVLIGFFGVMSAYGFSLIGRVCAYTGASSYREAWSKSVGERSSVLPAVSVCFKTFAAILAYSMILADTFQKLLTTAGITASRSNTLFGITSLVLLPLCLLKNLNALAPFSLLGIMGMGYTSLAMAFRYFGKAYSPGGAFFGQVAAPAFGSIGAKGAFTPSVVLLMCMLSTAYMAHFNAPKFYIELKDNTIPRYNTVVFTSFGAAIAIFAAVASLGFLTFGTTSSGLILNNYATTDVVMSLARVAVALSIVFSYPLAFVGFRDGILDIAKVTTEKRTNGLLNQLTVAILGAVTGLALVVKDLSFVLSFAGATLGNGLIYLFPAIMFRRAVKKLDEKGEATPGLKREVLFATASALMGVVMSVLGTKEALASLKS
eukprot:CAMPEP_0118712600 /NCGR_PEP_ID=MMETSP0800-20121206/24927_1 /TAXON_ID=210618 ORGANISM="Striatella unipunctata, Strain CCMP2910" /NCGR_SAMPLE_ID=MMETSP0800 /ASSEMBLY_ACC=CAM_ASM_000638 /LENGTH=460 /DNA_ID=CAMNT_0006617711 /DNA_START=143 /DNA_END=1525 /DNA_ORIENTATION=+